MVANISRNAHWIGPGSVKVVYFTEKIIIIFNIDSSEALNSLG